MSSSNTSRLFDLPIGHPGARFLGQLVTNMNLPSVRFALGYVESTVYAIQKLQLPNVSIYLDAAHAGWLDGTITARAYPSLQEGAQAAGGYDMIRGFATNVSNYTHLYNRDGRDGVQRSLLQRDGLCEEAGGGLSDNGVRNKASSSIPRANGKVNPQGVGPLVQHQGADWASDRGGRPPVIDAYFWIKPPGESDGISTRRSRVSMRNVHR